MRKRNLTVAAVVGMAMLAFGGVANAQVNTEPTGVARVSFIRGDVSMQRGDSGDASAVELNTPLVAGDKVFTGSRSRAEIQLDWANMLRLDENAEADIATLDRNRIQVQLSQGVAFFSVLRGSEAEVEIDTPNVAVIPRRDGRYRIEVLPSGDTLVTVREGEADISTPDGSTPLRNNQLITVRGAGSDVQFQIARAPGNDEFDRWNEDRDDLIARAESYRRTNRYYTGAADLDAYGRWDRIPDYGYVWMPRVALGWAPYRHGRWVWTAYWGWTWTSYEPWGWAPYHYGRWFVHRGNWVWWPGPVTPIYRPVYAPAYVSFFGFGSHSGFSVGVSFGSGFGSIGWLPAGPCDFVTPWWGRHRNNFNVVNITNITNVYNVRNVNVIAPLRHGNRDSNVHNMLVNNQVRYALSTVPAENFGRGRGNVRTVTTAELRDARFVAGNVPVVPSRESLRASDRAVNTPASRAQNQEQRFFSRRMPSTQRESFSDESARLRQTIERDVRLNSNAVPNRNAENRGPENRAGENRNADVRGTDNRPAAGFNGNRNGNAEVNSPRQTPQTVRPEMPQASQPQAPASGALREPGNGGWRRFGGSQPPDAPANSQPQREPVLRAPRQRSTISESSPRNRADAPASQPAPEQNGNRLSNTQPGFSRFSGLSSRRMESRDAERVIAQSAGGNQQSGNQSQQNSENRQANWERFAGGSRSSSSGNSSGAQTNSQPRTDSRPPIQLNRPIIQPRETAPPRNSAPSQPRDTGNRTFGSSPRGASREPAPSSSERFTAAPRSAPQPSAPRATGTPPAPQSGAQSSSRSGGSTGRSATSSNSRGRGQERR